MSEADNTSRVFQAYLIDTMHLLIEAGRERKLTVDASQGADNYQFELGQLMAFHEIITLLQSQAEAFGLPLQAIGLSDIDPDKDLL
jgi:hypothetical protein